LKFFAQRKVVEVVDYPPNECHSPEKVVKLAKERIGEKNYDLLYNNCEHFVSYCLTGKRQSKYMEHLKEQNLKIKKRGGVNSFLDKLYKTIKSK